MPSRIGWSFKHFDASTVEEAVRLLRTYQGKAKLIAGGTDLLNVLKDRILPEPPEAVINLKTTVGLDSVTVHEENVKIGALTRLKDVVLSPLIQKKYPLLWEAVRSIASPLIRNVATIGGNLCQDVRCWYYRAPHHIRGRILCKRKGGTMCAALEGDNRYHSIFGGSSEGCFAVCLSDTAIALTALGARVETSKRQIPLEELFRSGPATALESNEVLTRLHVTTPPDGSKGTYLKFRTRKATDFATVSVAVMLTLESETCKDARIVLGGVAPIPWRAKGAENALKGKTIDTAKAEKAGQIALEGARPLTVNGYKIPLTQALVKRAIMASL